MSVFVGLFDRVHVERKIFGRKGTGMFGASSHVQRGTAAAKK
jgi:hypothetical protein